MLGLGSGADSIPWLLPGVAVVLVAGILAGGRVGRALGAPPVVGWLLVAAVGLVLAATLTPQAGALATGHAGTGTCNLARVSPAPWEEYLSLHEATGNVLLFIPLGVAIGLLPRSRGKLLLLVAALALPFLVEALQAVLPVLDRACEGADVVDNLLGLALGLGIGSTVAFAARPRNHAATGTGPT